MPVAIDAAMKTLIEGGWVVAFNGKSHEVHEQGSVVFENDRIVHAGGPYTGAVDTRLSARGKLVSPGFINTHVHTTGNGGDYLLLDMAKNDYRTANYMSFAAPLKGKMTPPPPEAVAALRTFVFLHAIKQGTTTIIDVGGQRGDWEGYVRLVDELGVRVYGSPPFRDRNTFCDAQGRLYYDHDAALGMQGLKDAVAFIRSHDGAAGGRLRGMLNPSQVETCSEPLLRACKDAARELDVPVHTHAGGTLVEFQRIMDEYRKPPIQFLADIGFLDDRSLIGHGVFTTAHPWSHYPFGDDLRVLAERGATVGHCPYKYAKMAMTLNSFQRYLDAGERGNRHRHLPHGHGRRAPLDVHSGQGGRRELSGRPAPRRLQRRHAGELQVPAPRRPRPPRPGRQGRHRADQPRPPWRRGLRRSHQVPGGCGLRSRRGHGDRGRQNPGAGGPDRPDRRG